MAERVHAAAEICVAVCSLEETRRAVNELFPLFVSSVRMDAGTADLLRFLRTRDLKIALVSNASSYTETILDGLALREPFDAVVLSYALGTMKPDPSIYLHACALLGVEPAATVFVGDGGDRELEGARKCGMTTILVDRKLRHSAAAIGHADLIATDLPEVAELISAMGRCLS